MKKYQVSISFAGEDEKIVSEVYKCLISEGVKVFYAPMKQHEMAGEDLVKKEYQIYLHESDYVLAFISKDYVKKVNPMREARTALMKNMLEESERLIPVILDGTNLPGLDKDIVYIRSTDPIYIAAIVARKIGDGYQQEKNQNHNNHTNIGAQNNYGGNVFNYFSDDENK